MNENWREFLYYLGFLSSLAFTARFLLQWISSEIKKESVVTKSFWKISIVGNVLLMLHALIQLQFHVCVVQASNSVISWRNLNLMQPKEKQIAFMTVIILLIIAILGITCLFLLQGMLYSNEDIEWFRIPLNHTEQVSFGWHLVGFLGIFLFSSRFWIQWWFAEKQKKSFLGNSFWWISLSGGILSLIYFYRIWDPVNLVGPAFGMIPYIRNIMLLRKTSTISN